MSDEGEFPSGQRGQTVNLLAMPSVVRIHLPPPISELEKVLRFLFSAVFCRFSLHNVCNCVTVFSVDHPDSPFHNKTALTILTATDTMEKTFPGAGPHAGRYGSGAGPLRRCAGQIKSARAFRRAALRCSKTALLVCHICIAMRIGRMVFAIR